MPLRILGGFGQVQDYTVLVNVADGATMPTDDEIKMNVMLLVLKPVAFSRR